VLQHVAVCCSGYKITKVGMLQCVGVGTNSQKSTCCSVLQRVAACCSGHPFS